MKPDTSQWRDRKSYDYFDALQTEGLAWECLRRSVPYQQHYAKLIIGNLEMAPLTLEAEQLWGLRFRRHSELVRVIARGFLVEQRKHRRSRAHDSSAVPVARSTSSSRRPWRPTP